MAMPIKLRLTAYALGLATLLSCFSIKAIADGMPITSAYVTGSGNTTGTSATAFTGVAAPAAANQSLALSSTLGDITLAPGDSLCMVTAGTLAASAGCITIWGTPQ